MDPGEQIQPMRVHVQPTFCPQQLFSVLIAIAGRLLRVSQCPLPILSLSDGSIIHFSAFPKCHPPTQIRQVAIVSQWYAGELAASEVIGRRDNIARRRARFVEEVADGDRSEATATVAAEVMEATVLAHGER
jgi:hypothetical protein